MLVAVTALVASPEALAQKVTYPQAVAAVKAQLVLAITHAERALAAPTVELNHESMRRVVNCLEGARGANFRAAPGNPCQARGGGILPELRAAASLAPPALTGSRSPVGIARGHAESALRAALEDLCMFGLTEVRTDTASVLKFLRAALAALGG
jgi:hypothetical protein